MEKPGKNHINHIENQKIFTGWKNGNWWENGVCNPRRKQVKIGNVTEIYFNGSSKVFQIIKPTQRASQ